MDGRQDEHAQIEELLEAYALGALDPEERVRVAGHLASCAECRAVVEAYEETVAGLPLALAAASPLRPPDAARERLLRTVAGLPSGVAASDRDGSPNAAQAPDRDGAGPLVALPGGRSGRRAWRWWRPGVLAAAAAVLLLALSLGWSIRLSVALARERSLSANYAQLAEQVVGQQEVVLEVVDSPRTVRALLRPPPGTATGNAPPYGKLFTRPDLPHVVVMAARLPPPPPEQAYHLWLTREGRQQLVGTLRVNEQGFGLLVFDADRNGPVYEAARLTLQPEATTTPAEPPVILWEVQR